MRINLYTVVNRSSNNIEEFIKFYKVNTPNINIVFFNNNADENIINKIKELGCSIKEFLSSSYEDWVNNCWKYLPCDCVVIVDIDEYIQLEPDMFGNCTILKCTGYNLKDINNINEESRNENLDKLVIFDPRVIKELNYNNGSYNPQGFIRLGEKSPHLYKLIHE